MPNYCANRVTLTHTDATQLEQVRTGWKTGLFYSILPCDPTVADQRNRWGTKWDVSEADGSMHDDGDVITLTFDTAWCPPIEFYDHLVSLGFGVDATYYEPGMEFYGYYFDGSDDCNDYNSIDDIPDDIIEEYGIEEWDEEEA